MLRTLKIGLSYLTALPALSINSSITSAELGRSVWSFPLIGAIFGLANILGICVFILFDYLNVLNIEQFYYLSPLLVIVFNLVLSGGLHLNGLMNCFAAIDAPEKDLRTILQNLQSNIANNYGVISCIVLLIMKFTLLDFCLRNLKIAQSMTVLFYIPILSRFLLLLLIAFDLRPRLNPSWAKNNVAFLFAKHINPKHDILANALWISMGLICTMQILHNMHLVLDILSCIISGSLLAFGCYRILQHKLKFVNSDVLGATLEIAELSLLIAFLFLN